MDALKPFDRGKARTPEQAMEDILRYNPQQRQQQASLGVSWDGNAFTIRDVMLGGDGYTVHWPRIPPFEGRMMYDEWLAYAAENNYILPSLPLYAAVFHTLQECNHDAGGLEAGIIQQFCTAMRDQLRHVRFTDSTVCYNEIPDNLDRPDVIKHHLRIPDGYTIKQLNAKGIRVSIDNIAIPSRNREISDAFFDNAEDPAGAFKFIRGKAPVIDTMDRGEAKGKTARIVTIGDYDDGSFWIKAMQKPEAEYYAHMVRIERCITH